MSQEYVHVPVMLDEVLTAIERTPPLSIFDLTLGGAGHASAILSANPERRLIGLDQDEVAVGVARERLAQFGDRAHIYHARFDQIHAIAEKEGVAEGGVAAALFDLGVSSYQLDTPHRGFSYHNDGPLDMRMNSATGVTAAQFIDAASEEELSQLFFVHGETRFARKIAKALVAQRPFQTTQQLADLVTQVIPIPARRRGHPARRVFQALRVQVNAELDILGPALDAAIRLLAPGGRIIVMSYHSGEDKITKDHLLYGSTGGCVCPPALPCVCGAIPTLRLLNRGARMATTQEISRNPRSESVRLRIAERLLPSEERVRE